MDIQKILAAVDHTLLRPEATWEEIRQICEDGAAFGCASVCIPPSFVKRAADCLGDKLPGVYGDRLSQWLFYHCGESVRSGGCRSQWRPGNRHGHQYRMGEGSPME